MDHCKTQGWKNSSCSGNNYGLDFRAIDSGAPEGAQAGEAGEYKERFPEFRGANFAADGAGACAEDQAALGADSHTLGHLGGQPRVRPHARAAIQAPGDPVQVETEGRIPGLQEHLFVCADGETVREQQVADS